MPPGRNLVSADGLPVDASRKRYSELPQTPRRDTTATYLTPLLVASALNVRSGPGGAIQPTGRPKVFALTMSIPAPLGNIWARKCVAGFPLAAVAGWWFASARSLART